jgi:serine/threonine protein kinase
MALLNLLCPACHTPLPNAADGVVTCSSCAAEVDVTRAGTLAGRPRFVPEIDRAGTEVGGYRVETRLGSGGMGTVYRGVAAADGRKVALKFLSPALANSPDVVARFAREIEALRRLAHPAIVNVLAHGVEDGIPWFAMPLVEGSDLRARIAAGPLPPAETAAVFGRLFAALEHAHARGVIHRDLKPANVLIAADGARLADFGIARFEAESLAGTLVTRLTETAAIIGTLPYMPPEQRKGGAVDRRSDLFSAGVMLYEAATGALPQGAFAAPSELSPAYGRAFDRLVIQLLQADPARRPPSAGAAAATLAAALAARARGRMAVTASVVALATLLVGGGFAGRALLERRAGTKPKPAAVVLAPPRAATATPPPAAASPPETRPPADEMFAPMDLGKFDGKSSEKSGRRKVKQKIVLPPSKTELKSPFTAPPATAPSPAADSKDTGTDKDKDKDKVKSAGKPIPKTKALLDDAQFDEIEAEVKEAVPPPNKSRAKKAKTDAPGDAELPVRK